MARGKQPVLRFLAGTRALERIRDRGLDPGMVAGLAGAAGGPKWLVLNHLDREIFGHWLSDPVLKARFLIGSSVATWRFTCAAQQDPERAFSRFEEAYMAQRYNRSPSPREISDEARRILDHVLGPDGVTEILANPSLHLSIMATRSRGPAASEHRAVLAGGLAAAGLANVVTRRALGMLLGVYRDGGLLDYQMDLPFRTDGNIVLMPHYEARIVPGWFDKPLPWRRPHAAHMRDVVVVAPADSWIASLPGGKIPNRKDFYRYAGKDDERVRDWQRATEAGGALADAFMDSVESGRVRNLVEPLAVSHSP